MSVVVRDDPFQYGVAHVVHACKNQSAQAGPVSHWGHVSQIGPWGQVAQSAQAGPW